MTFESLVLWVEMVLHYCCVSLFDLAFDDVGVAFPLVQLRETSTKVFLRFIDVVSFKVRFAKYVKPPTKFGSSSLPPSWFLSAMRRIYGYVPGMSNTMKVFSGKVCVVSLQRSSSLVFSIDRRLRS